MQITSWLLMYGIIRTNATLWAESEIFFKRAKRQKIKLIRCPNNLLVIVICWFLTKILFLGFICIFLHLNLIQMKCREAIDFLSKLVLFWLKGRGLQAGCRGRSAVYPGEPSALVSHPDTRLRRIKGGGCFLHVFHWAWNYELYEINLTKETFVAISGTAE